jgi:type VI secretion system protein ImpL
MSATSPSGRGWGGLQAVLLALAWTLLAVWAVGIAVAGWQLGSWREELTRTLLQLHADAQFRARAHSRDAVDPEWYRRKALALLSATDRLRRNAVWTTFVPGSWHRFDPLQAQVQARVEHEFDEIVVETVRRELYARASRLTGVPLERGSGELQPAAECRSPVPQSLERKLAGAADDLPEFVAVKDYVAGVQRLDAATADFFALQTSAGRPEQLRQLVGYTLGKELPGALAGAVRMFHDTDEVSIQRALMRSRLQWATRCALGKAMSALHTRLLSTNDLFALEQGYVERSTGLFETAARPIAFDRVLERYRAVHALLADQNTLLTKGRNDWMRQGTLQLGPAYQRVLQQIARTQLLGPEVVEQLQSESGAAFAEFRRQFQLAFGNQDDPGIVWQAGAQRFGLSPERKALLHGLDALLKTSFMADEPLGTDAKGPQEARQPHDRTKAPEPGTLAKALEDAKTLAAERGRAMAQIVPTFPARMQPAVERVVNARVSELIYQKAYRALRAALPRDADQGLDPAVFRRQRDQVMALHAVLKQTGGAGLGDRLVATLDGELVRRLAALQQEWNAEPVEDARIDDFAGWQGGTLPLAQMFGASASGTSPPSFAATAGRLADLVQRAHALLALGSPRLAGDPAVARWQQLQAEVGRYKARAADSSLLRLELYLAHLGPDFSVQNCAERLAGQAPTGTGDTIAARHLQLHLALARRCEALRIQALLHASSFAQPATSPASVVQ